MKKFSSLLSLIFVITAIWYTFYSSMPRNISGPDTPENQFSTLRALEHVKEIARTQHYLGSPTHNQVRDYILEELRKLGLSPEIQEGFSVGKTGVCSRVQNIVAKIEGTTPGKALLLLSHYDSAPHTSYGASDAGSGVATILEGIRAFLINRKTSKNDIIICITDGEELGLNGADYLVKNHPWTRNVGLVLNFEARGSGGHSFMLMETNAKNSVLIDHFKKAKTPHPVTNSLAYSIYKMLPNDTDLTVFREQGNIEGFNFAFIDDHYDYHSANDTWENLDLSTLQHQGSYLMALLPYFSETDLSNLKSETDDIYFNFPIFNIVKYPYAWIFPMLFVAFVLFIILIFYGKTQFRIEISEVIKGGIALLIALILSGLFCAGGWKLITLLYPRYLEIQHGFTYNGHTYIAAFVLLSLGICFKIYAKIHEKENQPSLQIPALGIWLLICLMTSLYVQGASYFVVLVFFGLISLFVTIRQKQPSTVLLALLCFPSIYILTPFIANFPVALGLNILFISGLLTVLLFALMLPIFGFYRRKSALGNVFLFLAFIFLIIAHFKSDFTETRQKPNSLLYILDTDENKGVWATYDQVLDSWTENYISPEENTAAVFNKNTLENKYAKQFSFVNEAPLKIIPEPIIEIREDTIIGNSRKLYVCIAAQRTIDRLDIYTKNVFNFEKLRVNGSGATDFVYKNGETYNAFTKRWDKKLLTHYVTKNEPLEIHMQFHKDSVPSFVLYESSYDLLENQLFSIPARDLTMMPKPFLLNDAVVVKKSFTLDTQKNSRIQKDTISLK